MIAGRAQSKEGKTLHTKRLEKIGFWAATRSDTKFYVFGFRCVFSEIAMILGFFLNFLTIYYCPFPDYKAEVRSREIDR